MCVYVSICVYVLMVFGVFVYMTNALEYVSLGLEVMHAYMHMHIHVCMHAYIYSNIYTCMCISSIYSYIYTYMRAYI